MIDDEGKQIFDVLNNFVDKRLDGKETILSMKKSNSNNWKQMEWIGWFLEEESRMLLSSKIGGTKGPSFGNTAFDYKNKYVWDIKSHSVEDKNGVSKTECILNDEEAIDCALNEYGVVGFVIYTYKPDYDISGDFKKWHDELKGEISEYEKERMKRNAPSRSRKSGCVIKSLIIIKLTKEDIEKGQREGWIKDFQKGMRNADGSPRRNKITIKIDKVPANCIIVKSGPNLF